MSHQIFNKNDIEVLKKETVFNGFFRVDKYTLKHALFDGGYSTTFQREIFERGQSACVLPWDPKSDQIVLVEQFRVGALEHKVSPWLLEIVAGMVDKNETPAEVVTREAKEEANLDIKRLKKIGSYLASPGGTTERVWLFIGEIDASKAGGVHGLEDENEDIRVQVFDREQISNDPFNSRYDNAATLLALQWLNLNLDKIRLEWT